MSMVVDLPAPFGPSSATTSPDRTVRFSSSTAVSDWYLLVSPASRIAASWSPLVSVSVTVFMLVPVLPLSRGISGANRVVSKMKSSSRSRTDQPPGHCHGSPMTVVMLAILNSGTGRQRLARERASLWITGLAGCGVRPRSVG